MFKNAAIYKIKSRIEETAEQIEEALHANIFTECGSTQEKSIGWAPPRGKEHGALLESVGGHWILKLMIESKKVPSNVLKRTVEANIKAIEAATGRKPGKKEKKSLADDARIALLPMAFSTVSTVTLWIAPQAGTLILDTGSQSKADEALTWLIKAVDGLALQLVNTQTSPAAAMAHWLATKEAPNGFSVDRECELKATDESKAVVKYGRHALDTDEVAQHIAMGKMPTRLALTWGDRVSFVLTDGMLVKKIAFLEGVFEGQQNDKAADAFDADVAIMTGELSKLIPALIEALGDEVAEQAAPVAGAESPATPAAPHTGDGPDQLYDNAVAIVRQHQKASISMVQRYLAIGYNRAARLLEDMETAGIVSPMNNSGARTLLGAGVAA